nr:glycosyltransferase family 2 protein [Pseudoduganella umbonata]
MAGPVAHDGSHRVLVRPRSRVSGWRQRFRWIRLGHGKIVDPSALRNEIQEGDRPPVSAHRAPGKGKSRSRAGAEAQLRGRRSAPCCTSQAVSRCDVEAVADRRAQRAVFHSARDRADAAARAQRVNKVLVSILNWNGARQTLDCVHDLLRQELPAGASADILVIDNGSASADVALLAQGLADLPVALRRETVNHGFAGGHNLAVAHALDEKYDFLWLVNSDAVMGSATVLAQLLDLMALDERCGAASPLLAILDQPEKVYFCGNFHDWDRLDTRRASNVDDARTTARKLRSQQWVPGTAMLLRAKALRDAGKLDERMFAYYEDDELCARLAVHGWHSAVAYDAHVLHAMPRRETDRPAYYFYLMARNYLIFWHDSTPHAHRRRLKLKLLDRALYDVNRLYYRGFPEQAEAALLGVEDFLRRRYGRPVLERTAGFRLRALRVLLWLPHLRVLRRLDRTA